MATRDDDDHVPTLIPVFKPRVLGVTRLTQIRGGSDTAAAIRTARRLGYDNYALLGQLAFFVKSDATLKALVIWAFQYSKRQAPLSHANKIRLIRMFLLFARLDCVRLTLVFPNRFEPNPTERLEHFNPFVALATWASDVTIKALPDATDAIIVTPDDRDHPEAPPDETLGHARTEADVLIDGWTQYFLTDKAFEAKCAGAHPWVAYVARQHVATDRQIMMQQRLDMSDCAVGDDFFGACPLCFNGPTREVCDKWVNYVVCDPCKTFWPSLDPTMGWAIEPEEWVETQRILALYHQVEPLPP